MVFARGNLSARSLQHESHKSHTCVLAGGGAATAVAQSAGTGKGQALAVLSTANFVSFFRFKTNSSLSLTEHQGMENYGEVL